MPQRISSVLFLAACLAYGSVNAQSTGIAVVVNGTVITSNEVSEAVKAQESVIRMQLRDDPAAMEKALRDVRKEAIDSLIDRELILKEFQKMGGTIKAQYVDDDINKLVRESFNGDRDAFVSELARAGLTLKKFRGLREKMIIVQAMRAQFASDQSPPTPAEVRSFYDKNIDQFRDKDMIKIRTITVPKFTGDPNVTVEAQRRFTNDLRSKILAGASFADIARAHSQDSSSDQGGERPWMERTQMNPKIANAAFAVKVGGISPVVEDTAAFILISVDAIQRGKAEPLEAVRPKIEGAIRSEKSKAALDSYLESLRRKAIIKRYDR